MKPISTVSPTTAAADPLWFAHRYDPQQDHFHLIRLDREGHRRATFLTDEYLPADLPKLVVRRDELLAAAPAAGPIHFIFHSAFCGSTVLARAFDLPGWAMGLKEPPLLQDIVGWRRRGGAPASVGTVLDQSLRLLARPMSRGEMTVVKPSNIVNGLAQAMLAMRPDARALLLHAPVRTYLASIAKKGMWGRWWARELFLGLLKEGAVQRLGFDMEQLLGQTDLQIAAVGWLAQHALFADLARTLGPGRVRTLDSETLMAQPRAVMEALTALYQAPLAPDRIDAIVAGPAFTTHSKSRAAFGPAARASEYAEATALHAEEIDKVAIWIEVVAKGAQIPMRLPAPLLA